MDRPRVSDPVVAWTGTALLVVSGYSYEGQPAGPSGRYERQGDSWVPMAQPPVEIASSAVGVWTGSRLVVWGGARPPQAGVLATGAVYDPMTDRWTPMSTEGAPRARTGHSAIWTGQEVVIWGGFNGYVREFYSDGARYDPATDRWRPMSSTDAPAARLVHEAIWTGREMIRVGRPDVEHHRGPGGHGRPLRPGR